MKILTLLFSRIKQLASKRKVVFILFIIGGVLNSVMFAYMYGNLMPIVTNYNSTEFQYRKYQVFRNGMDLTYGFHSYNPDKNYFSDEDIQRIIDTGLFETVIVDSVYGESNPDGSPVPDSVCACVYGAPDYLIIGNGKGALTSDDQVIINSFSASSVGDIAVIRGEEYEVVGRSAALNLSYMITADKYISLGAFTNHLILISSDRWHLNNNAPLDSLKDLFPDAYVAWSSQEESDLEISHKVLPGILINFAVTMIAFVFILNYLASVLSNENAVSIIVGGRPADITIMAILEGVTLSILTVIAGLFLHYLLYDALFSKFLMGLTLDYKFKDYVVMFCMMAIISIIIMTIRSIRYLKTAPFKLRSREL